MRTFTTVWYDPVTDATDSSYLYHSMQLKKWVRTTFTPPKKKHTNTAQNTIHSGIVYDIGNALKSFRIGRNPINCRITTFSKLGAFLAIYKGESGVTPYLA